MAEHPGRPVIAHGHIRLERPGAAVRLLVFHHAAGSAMSYLPLAGSMGDACEPWLVELGGRGVRAGTPFPAEFGAAVAELLPAVAAIVDRPTVVIGHSLGALLAHSVVATLDDRRRALVRALVLSAARSPRTTALSATHPDAPFVTRSPESLRDDLATFGGLPAEAETEPELWEHALTTLGHDLHLADTYVPPAGPPLAVPAHFWYGSDDPIVGPGEAGHWAESLAQPPEVRRFVGGHFYLGTAEAARSALRGLVSEAAAAATPG
jgi:pyochelin biosynthetic protein PchC